MNEKVIAKFWDNVVKTDTCWNWAGKTMNNGRVLFFTRGTTRYLAKKVSLDIHGRTATKRVGNTCGNYLCVNPDHLVSGDAERFWSKVSKSLDGCWYWTGQTRGPRPDLQYGVIHLRGNGRNTYLGTHVFSWELHSGQTVPEGLFVCHTCDNTRCVNPVHLFLGTANDNNQDRHNKNRDAKGEGHGRAILTEADVISVRKRHSKGESYSALAREFGMSHEAMSQAINGKTWKCVPLTT